MAAPEPYHGPVFFIIHALSDTVEPMHEVPARVRKTLLRAVNEAGKRGIPILDCPLITRNKIDPLTPIIAEAKYKPPVIKATNETYQDPKKIRSALVQKNIHPTQIICLGAYRELCVTTGAINAKKAFPKTSVVVVEGHNTVSLGGNLSRIEQRARFAVLGIKRAKKLNPRHFVK